MSDRVNLLISSINLAIEFLRKASTLTPEEKAELWKLLKEGIASIFTL